MTITATFRFRIKSISNSRFGVPDGDYLCANGEPVVHLDRKLNSHHRQTGGILIENKKSTRRANFIADAKELGIKIPRGAKLGACWDGELTGDLMWGYQVNGCVGEVSDRFHPNARIGYLQVWGAGLGHVLVRLPRTVSLIHTGAA